MEKLRAEITAASDACSIITRDTLKNMSYLKNVLTYAALRLYPPVPVNTRTAIRNTVLPVGGGFDGKSPVLIPEGSSVAFSIYSMHRRPDLFGMDAELFRPERWEKHMPFRDDPVRAKWSYIPFYGGPRSCPGRMYLHIVWRGLLTDSNRRLRSDRSGVYCREIITDISSHSASPW
jgi:cytochrome P450